MTHVLVTGATGFIGHHLVKELSQGGFDVSCLVRETSNRDQLESSNPRFLTGDVNDRDSIRHALRDVDVVYHLAGTTKSLNRHGYAKVNELGARNVAAVCDERENPPVLVHVSSLAAAGPASADRARVESDAENPVSHYGESKRASELAVMEFASHVPTTIVRPPIVFGEGDRDAYSLFQGVANWRLHLVPSFADDRISMVHVDDLVHALILSAQKGQRLNPVGEGKPGIYFAAADEQPTYAELGRLIAEVFDVGVIVVRCPKTMVWMVASGNELISQIRRRPHILGLDKAREATAGSWSCSAEALKRDTGFQPGGTLHQRLSQTAQWYIDEGWLSQPKRWIARRRPESGRRLGT